VPEATTARRQGTRETTLTDERSKERATLVARAASEKQGSRIVLLDVGDVLTIVDWFVITSAGNARQVRTIADEIEARMKREGEGAPLRVEGLDDAAWILIDYGDVVAHVFLEDVRAYYELERLWSDVGRIDWADDGVSARAAEA